MVLVKARYTIAGRSADGGHGSRDLAMSLELNLTVGLSNVLRRHTHGMH